ncbi:MAG: ATPase [Gammaproteobacteria bacterium]|nr:ATPase [Gammaproteobacteria bacterium]
MDFPSGLPASEPDEGIVLPLGPRVQAVLRLAYATRKPVLLEGPTGIGKSELIAATAAALGIEHRILDLSLLEPSDLVGLPMIHEGRTHYACPAALPQDGQGLLLLEELNRAERFVQNPALQLLTARSLHDYRLPEGWSMVAAINPEDGSYQVTPLDPALRKRFMQIRVRADRSAWLAWAQHQALHPAVMQIARHYDRLFDDVPPRTWRHVSDLLRGHGRRRDERALRDALGGYLPPVWIEPLLRFHAGEGGIEGVELERLLTDYHRDRRAQQLVVGARKDGRTDILELLVDQIETRLTDHAESATLIRRRGLSLDSLERLFQDLPGDQVERLQRAFGANPYTIALLRLEPGEALARYREGTTALAVSRWLAGQPLRHRAWAFVTGVERYLREHPRPDLLRADPAVRDGLACLLAQLDPPAGKGLRTTAERLGLLDGAHAATGGRRP